MARHGSRERKPRGKNGFAPGFHAAIFFRVTQDRLSERGTTRAANCFCASLLRTQMHRAPRHR